jgi:hypothetical protein
MHCLCSLDIKWFYNILWYYCCIECSLICPLYCDTFYRFTVHKKFILLYWGNFIWFLFNNWYTNDYWRTNNLINNRLICFSSNDPIHWHHSNILIYPRAIVQKRLIIIILYTILIEYHNYLNLDLTTSSYNNKIERMLKNFYKITKST